MAFVYEVERPPLFEQKKATSEIGPGQYLPLTLYKFEKPNAVPFGASAKRGSLFKLNQFPGPGAYNPKEDQNISYHLKSNIYDKLDNNKKKKKSKKKIITKKINVIDKYEKKENLGFFTKVERFNEIDKTNTPGPGTYDDKNILLAKSIEEKCYNNKEIIYNTNKERHNVYFVNRFDRQFPWNSEVISLNNKKFKKNKKNKSVDINKKIKSFKNIESNANSGITISKLEKNKTIKSDSSSNMNTNIKDFLINNLEEKQNKIKYKNIEGLNDIKINKSKENTNKLQTFKKKPILKKSKTSSDFFSQERTTKKELKQKLNNEIKYRISSIPSKFSQGYEIEQTSGKVIRKPIKTYFKKCI